MKELNDKTYINLNNIVLAEQIGDEYFITTRNGNRLNVTEEQYEEIKAYDPGSGGGGGGGADLNLAYALTPPSDTSKIWVKCDTPSKVEVVGNVNTRFLSSGKPYQIVKNQNIPLTFTGYYHVSGIKCGDRYIFIQSNTAQILGETTGASYFKQYYNGNVTNKSMGESSMLGRTAIRNNDTSFTAIFLWGTQTYFKTYELINDNWTFTKEKSINSSGGLYWCKSDNYYYVMNYGSNTLYITKVDIETASITNINIAVSSTPVFPSTVPIVYYNGALYFIGANGSLSSSANYSLYKWVDGTSSFSKVADLISNITTVGVWEMNIYNGKIIISQIGQSNQVNKLIIYNIETNEVETININNSGGVTIIDYATGDIELWGGYDINYTRKTIDFNYVLEKDTLNILTGEANNNELLPIIDTPNLVFNLPLTNALLGDVNNIAEPVLMFKYKNGYWNGINNVNWQTSINEETSGTTLTNVVYCNVGDLIVASVVARDSGNESVSSDWTLLGRSQVGELNQTLAFYYKIATSTKESITITQSSNARIYCSMVAFTGKTTATMGTFSFNANSLVGTITLPNKLCVVSVSCNLWDTNVPYPLYTYSPLDSDVVTLATNQSTQNRLGTWVDDNGGERTITAPLITPTTNTLIIGYVTIE